MKTGQRPTCFAVVLIQWALETDFLVLRLFSYKPSNVEKTLLKQAYFYTKTKLAVQV